MVIRSESQFIPYATAFFSTKFSVAAVQDDPLLPTHLACQSIRGQERKDSNLDQPGAKRKVLSEVDVAARDTRINELLKRQEHIKNSFKDTVVDVGVAVENRPLKRRRMNEDIRLVKEAQHDNNGHGATRGARRTRSI